MALRKEAGVSQAEMAKHLDLCQPDISKIETFDRRLDALEFTLWLNKISKTPEDLIALFNNVLACGEHKDLG